MSKNLLNVFLADDDSDDRTFFSDALREIPIQTKISEFNNGVDLMAGLLSDTVEIPDVIFLDLKMPMMDGFECLADIRDLEKYANTPVIIYSTSYHPKEIIRLNEMGASLYLQKPSSYNQLKTLLHKCLRYVDNSEHNKPEREFVISI
ncbi:response regulator receiver domain-containing protein [Maribacter caenipelagi]|uniref:Response regulator receiver domain-containing protein n=1 Tax=Maribacter caenipelagi TaxID=1447781 RepID=A0A4R7CY50_9FLAO|nr:response regulator [Maribacter caenipelagi]TDS12025.1 response regulator receiver domain-containing protein [Maribacter caenipelagi]